MVNEEDEVAKWRQLTIISFTIHYSLFTIHDFQAPMSAP